MINKIDFLILCHMHKWQLFRKTEQYANKSIWRTTLQKDKIRKDSCSLRDGRNNNLLMNKFQENEDLKNIKHQPLSMKVRQEHRNSSSLEYLSHT